MSLDEKYELRGCFKTSIFFDSTEQFKNFIENQLNEYKNISSNFYNNQLDPINTIITKLANVNSQIDNVLSSVRKEVSPHPQHIHLLQTGINELSKYWVAYDHPMLSRLLLIFEEHGKTGAEAFWVNVTGSFKQPGSHSQMMGLISAYDFLSERKNLLELSKAEHDFVQEHYENAIERGNELERARKSLDQRIADWEHACQESWNEWELSCNEYWDSLTGQKSSEWESDRSVCNAEHDELIANSTKKLMELESTYQEHLKLEKPAQYWEKSAKKYADAGAWWGGVLVLLILVGLIGFIHFYSLYLEGQKLEVELNTVKGIVLFISGITVYGFLIRVVSRLLMSATHLQRDSEERAQLTYFYLALIKDGAIDEKSRDIVIQSLFSRTETGLLSGESSPTMPATDLIKNLKVGG